MVYIFIPKEKKKRMGRKPVVRKLCPNHRKCVIVRKRLVEAQKRKYCMDERVLDNENHPEFKNYVSIVGLKPT